jgi:hypothetical protein
LNKGGVLGTPGNSNTGRSFFYSSASASLVLNEAFKLDYRWLDLAKVRAAYGRVGRDAPPYRSGAPGFDTNLQEQSNAFPFNGVPAIGVSTAVNNPALTPEFSTELELGTELTMFRGRISFNGTYYDKRSTNQIAPLILPGATGYASRWSNFGEISNKGFEVALTVVPVEAAGFRWSSTFNYTRNRNIVESLTKGVDTLTLARTFGGGTVLRSLFIPGQPYGVIYGSAPLRDANGEPYINPIDGRMVRGKNKIVANPNPDFLMGFINQFTYKGITLNTLVDFRYGGQLYSTTLTEELGRGVTKDTENRDRLIVINGIRWDPVTKTGAVDGNGNILRNTTAITVNDLYFSPAGVGGGAATNGYDEQSIYDATTVRLREVTLGYDLPKKLLAKTPFGIINISVSGRNLWWYSPNLPKHSNFDPETSTYGASNQQGYEFTNAPTTKRYGVNLRVNF